MTKTETNDRIEEITKRLRQAMTRVSKANGEALEAARDAGAAIGEAKALLQGAAFRSWCRNAKIARSWAYKLIKLSDQWSDVPAARTWFAKRCDEPIVGVERMLEVLARWRTAHHGGDGQAQDNSQQPYLGLRRRASGRRGGERAKLRIAAMRIALLEDMIKELGAVPPPRSDVERTVIAEGLGEDQDADAKPGDDVDAGSEGLVIETALIAPAAQDVALRPKRRPPSATKPTLRSVGATDILLLPAPPMGRDEPEVVNAVIWKLKKAPPIQFRIKQ